MNIFINNYLIKNNEHIKCFLILLINRNIINKIMKNFFYKINKLN